jgi:hypothetical protein
MDSRTELIKAFYAALPKDRLKLETRDHGFPFLDAMLSAGITLEYGERVLLSDIYKYKLANVPGWKMDELLSAHVRKECNVCLYFNDGANSLFCFNLDKAPKTGDIPNPPEMTLGLTLLRDILAGLRCEPLIVQSGKGYHLWCRLTEPVGNEDLYNFMMRAMAKAFYGLHRQGLDHNKINARFYPDPRTLDKISLRLCGSEHMKTRTFSHVLAPDGVLDEEASWRALELHLNAKPITPEVFRDACQSLTIKSP